MIAADLFEVQRWVARVGFQQREILVGKCADTFRQVAISRPERGQSVSQLAAATVAMSRQRLLCELIQSATLYIPLDFLVEAGGVEIIKPPAKTFQFLRSQIFRLLFRSLQWCS